MKREIAGLLGLVGAWQVVKRALEQRLGHPVSSETSEDTARRAAARRLATQTRT